MILSLFFSSSRTRNAICSFTRVTAFPVSGYGSLLPATTETGRKALFLPCFLAFTPEYAEWTATDLPRVLLVDNECHATNE